jgi:hypothetical protein
MAAQLDKISRDVTSTADNHGFLHNRHIPWNKLEASDIIAASHTGWSKPFLSSIRSSNLELRCALATQQSGNGKSS